MGDISDPSGLLNESMCYLAAFRTNPEQVQIFTPTPSTVSTAMYCTGKDLDGKLVFSEKDIAKKRKQKEAVVR